MNRNRHSISIHYYNIIIMKKLDRCVSYLSFCFFTGDNIYYRISSAGAVNVKGGQKLREITWMSNYG
ncbi:MAG: hypothetical protein JW822_10145 [Spirochaetales bacterium]|nr:hypothetical protein [Spirochaetales bacterium]